MSHKIKHHRDKAHAYRRKEGGTGRCLIIIVENIHRNNIRAEWRRSERRNTKKWGHVKTWGWQL